MKWITLVLLPSCSSPKVKLLHHNELPSKSKHWDFHTVQFWHSHFLTVFTLWHNRVLNRRIRIDVYLRKKTLSFHRTIMCKLLTNEGDLELLVLMLMKHGIHAGGLLADRRSGELHQVLAATRLRGGHHNRLLSARQLHRGGPVGTLPAPCAVFVLHHRVDIIVRTCPFPPCS